jgi:hypothetical protein
MQHASLTRAARILVATGSTVALLSLGSGAVLAGEVTGNGTLKEVHGRSACAFSGQEDLQWFVTDENLERLENPVKGVPGHAQSWGQIDKATRAFLTSIGMNPGNACNPTRASAEG